MKKVFLFLVSLCFAGVALADAPIKWWYTNLKYPNTSDVTSCQTWVSSDAAAAGFASPTYDQVYTDGSGSKTCYFKWGTTTRFTGNQGMSYKMLCWDQSAPDLSQTTANQCSPQNQCLSKQGTGTTVGYPVGYVGADGRQVGSIVIPHTGDKVNMGGCEATLTVSNVNCTSPSNGPWPALVTCTMPATYTGNQSSAAPPSPPPMPSTTPDSAGKCPAGTVSGGVDSAGVPICIGNSDATASPDAGKTTTSTGAKTTNADGSNSQTTTKTTTNKDGSTTTESTTTTTQSDGSSSSTTTVTTSSSPLGKKGTSDQDQSGDLCAKHPELNVCKNSTVGGSCGSITCTGDAIQCSILREAALRNCQDKADKDAINTDPAYNLGNQVMNGNDPQASMLPTPANASSVSMASSLDASGWLGGGACFPDKTFSVQGHSITISFTSACQPLIAFRYALMVIALLVSFRMLSGVIFRE